MRGRDEHAVSRHVRATLFALATGVAAQRVLALLVTLLIGRHVGLAAFGEYASGVQIALLVALLADGGIRLLTAREMGARPERAVATLRASLALRSRLALGATVAFAAIAVVVADAWPFHLACAGLVLVAPFDQKQLADALGRAGTEVRWEAAASLTYLVLAAVLVGLDCHDLGAFVGALLVSRLVYAAHTVVWLRGLPPTPERVPMRDLLRTGSVLGVTQLANELIFAADIVLLRALVSREAAALYAAAQRIVLAADTPVRVLARLLQPHLMHAAVHGDAAGTLARGLRASAHLVLPIAAGGCVVAPDLLALAFGADFAAAAPTLRWLLGASVVLGAASLYGNLLVAHGAVLPYLACLSLGMVANVALTLWWIGPFGAAGSAAASFVAMTLASGLALVLLRRRLTFPLLSPWLRPVLHAALVMVAAWLPGRCLTPGAPSTLGAQLLAGGLALVLGLQAFEMRGRWRSFGEGLERASGFGRTPGELPR